MAHGPYNTKAVEHNLISRVNHLYCVFGSGLFHDPHAHLRTKTKSFNNDCAITFLCLADISMVVYFTKSSLSIVFAQNPGINRNVGKWDAPSKKSIMVRVTEEL